MLFDILLQSRINQECYEYRLWNSSAITNMDQPQPFILPLDSTIELTLQVYQKCILTKEKKINRKKAESTQY